MRSLGIWIAGLTLGLAAAAAPAAAQTPGPNILRRWTSPVLTRFESEAELRRYLRDIERAQRASYAPSGRRRIQFAQAEAPASQADTQEPVCLPDDPACAGVPANSEGDIVLTASRQSSNPSITNTQEAGVDEGDIVKQIGQYLLVLQDGRIFSIDTRAAGGAGLALVDRKNVYRNAREDTWYDEMLVTGNRVLITGYSYAEEATELAVFRLDPATGRLTAEGVFFLSSNDYYDTQNYATRLVGDRLVVYTPIDLSELDIDRPFEWPVVRRWQPEAGRARPARGRPLLGARDIYRPVRDVAEPYVHTVSVCPLGSVGGGRELDCRTTGFIGPRDREFHVSPTDAYLWVNTWDDVRHDSSGDAPCGAGYRPPPGETLPSLLFRQPLSGDDASVLGVRGDPINYLSLDTGGGRFRALTRWPSKRCNYGEEPWPLTYFDIALDRFDGELREAPQRAYTPVPSVGTSSLENRFTDHYLVYGGRRGWSSYPPDAPNQEPTLVATVPFARPSQASLVTLPHSILRIERAGDNVVLTGYRDDSALDVSLIDLRAAPTLASTVRLPGRYETEGRSHAFNSLVEADGRGLMGVPTSHRDGQAGRGWSYSEASDVSFLAVDARGRLAPLGELVAYANGPNQDNEGDDINDEGVWILYNCEVSCIDWYGNSRPIFTDGRVFGLAGSELIEGRVEGGRIRELSRLNITVGVPPSR